MSGGSTAVGAYLVLWDCNGHSDQVWMRDSDGSCRFWLRTWAPVCGTVEGASRDNGAYLVDWYGNGSADQIWNLG